MKVDLSTKGLADKRELHEVASFDASLPFPQAINNGDRCGFVYDFKDFSDMFSAMLAVMKHCNGREDISWSFFPPTYQSPLETIGYVGASYRKQE